MPRVCEPECPILVSFWADFAVFMSQSLARSFFESYRDRKGRLGCPCWAFPPLMSSPLCQLHSLNDLRRSLVWALRALVASWRDPFLLSLRGSRFIYEGR